MSQRDSVREGATKAGPLAAREESDDLLVFEDRQSDSPFVERIWRSQSTRTGTFHSMAATHCGLVITRLRGRVKVTLRGPETRATIAECPADGEWFGITFASGTFLTEYPAATLRDRQDVDLSGATRQGFRLSGTTWEYPSFDNAEVFVARLARAGVIARDPAVASALAGDPGALSRRSAQRHFLQATGMTHSVHRQIQRARRATDLLRQGASIQDVTYQVGYYDQPHLTRSLRRFVGMTPAEVQRQEHQLSLLYKTDSTR